MCVCVRACAFVCVYAHTHTHTHIHIQTHTHTHTQNTRTHHRAAEKFPYSARALARKVDALITCHCCLVRKKKRGEGGSHIKVIGIFTTRKIGALITRHCCLVRNSQKLNVAGILCGKGV